MFVFGGKINMDEHAGGGFAKSMVFAWTCTRFKYNMLQIVLQYLAHSGFEQGKDTRFRTIK